MQALRFLAVTLLTALILGSPPASAAKPNLLLPTLLDIAGIKHPKGFDGRSFLPVIKGDAQGNRDSVFKVYNENAGGNRHPIRGVETKRYLYLFNPWSDGKNVFKTATNGTATYRLMKKMAPDNPTIAARLDLMDHRRVEELYDVENDLDCIQNLINDPAHQAVATDMRERLLQNLKGTNDHALAPFLKRNDRAALAAYMTKVQDEATERRAKRRQKKRKNNQKAKPKANNRARKPAA